LFKTPTTDHFEIDGEDLFVCFFRMIQALMDQNVLLNQTLQDRGLAPATATAYPSSAQNQYCLNNPCYTPTEFGLYGVCIGIAGIFIAIFVVRKMYHQC
jgi:hypothetical protein